MATVILKQEVDAQEFWSNIFGAGWDTFGDWWTSASFIGGNWETVCQVRLSIENPEGGAEITKTIGLDDLVTAYEKCVALRLMHVDYLDWENLDAIGSDGILQVAVLGGVIYG